VAARSRRTATPTLPQRPGGAPEPSVAQGAEPRGPLLPSPAADNARHSIPAATAYRMLAIVLKDLESAERVLGQTEDTVPDPERRLHLGALRSAIAELKTVVAAEG
jgi:hypothetical protein